MNTKDIVYQEMPTGKYEATNYWHHVRQSVRKC